MGKGDIKTKRSQVSFFVPLIILVIVVLFASFVFHAILVSSTMKDIVTDIQRSNFTRIVQVMADNIQLELKTSETQLAYNAKMIGLMIEHNHDTRPDLDHRLDKHSDVQHDHGGKEDLISIILEDFNDMNSRYENTFMLSLTGLVVASVDEAVIGKNLSDREYYKEIIENKKDVYTSRNPFVSKVSGKGVIFQAVPVKWHGQLVGLLATVIDLKAFGQVAVLNNTVGETGYPYVMDEKGLVIIHTSDESLYINIAEEIPFLKTVIDNPEEVQAGSYEFNGVRRAGSFVRIPRNGWVVGIAISYSEIFASFGRLRNVVFSIDLIVILLIVLVLFFYIKLKIIRSIKAIEIIMGTAAEGNLIERSRVKGRDEMASMSGYFNTLLDSLTSFFRKLSKNLTDLEGVGLSLSSQTEETAAAVYEIQTNVNNSLVQIQKQEESVSSTVTAIEEITQNIQSLDNTVGLQEEKIEQGSSAVEEMVAQIKAVSSSTEEAERLMGILDNSSRTGRDNIQKVSDMVNDISDKSRELEQANALIAGIAAQTNLLAMNAAIEAAHAGDAGKGFAVVADEIRKLAEQSTEQSSQVKQTITNINNSIQEVVIDSESSTRSFEDILGNVEKVSRITNEIKRSMEEQVAGSSQVLDSLLEAVSSLSQISSEVAMAIQEIGKGMEEINQAVRSITESAEINKNSIEEVRMEAKSYKVE